MLLVDFDVRTSKSANRTGKTIEKFNSRRVGGGREESGDLVLPIRPEPTNKYSRSVGSGANE